MLRHSMSLSQQGLWFLSRIDARTNAAYNVVLALRAESPIDADRLQRVLTVLQMRHEALRCRIVSELGVPAIDLFEAEQVPPWVLQHRTGDLTSIAAEEGNRPFSMEHAPLARAILVTSPDTADADGLVFVVPHLLFDDASARILLQDIECIDGALGRGEGSTRLHPVGSLVESIGREQTLASSQKMKALAETAAAGLAGMPERLAFPGTLSSPHNDAVHTGAAVEMLLSSDFAARSKDFLRQQRTTPAAACLGAFLLLLWKVSRQTDFGVSVPVSNRGSHGTQQVIGYFTNVGIVRSSIDPKQTVTEFLAALNERWWNLLDSCELPFPLLAKHVKHQGGDLQQALLQIGFNHLTVDVSDAALTLGNVPLHTVQVLPKVVKNQLKLDVQQSLDRIRCIFLYDRSALRHDMVLFLAQAYERLLDAMMRNPALKLRDLPLMDEAQCEIVLRLGRGEPMPLPRKGLHQLVEEQAARTPNARAVVFGRRELSYAQVNGRANALARQLRERGVGPDRLVAVCAERSVEMLVALLAVLKAGGAYVPLDPAYPSERLAMMLADCGAQVVLVQPGLIDSLPTKSPVLMLEDDDLEEGDLGLPCESQHLAYCIYTSGSTGKPKGALNTHEGIVNRLLWMQMAYGLCADDVVLQKTPYSFDVSVWEFFWPLITGACLVIADPDAHRDPAQLRATIERYEVTTVHFVPSMLQAFLDAQPQVNLPTVRRIVCSGEALAAATMQRCFGALPGVALQNLYGPTECAVDVSAWQCSGEADTVPIGRAIANVQLHVLDECGQLVPAGVLGELYIAGVAIGRGYLNRAVLTAEKFVPDPYGEPGSRMYKTGDLARMRDDGNIEFLGRLDDQVKIRGLRIELGEVEAVLRECEGVHEAVVRMREDEPGNKRLVAYVGIRDGAAPAVDLLRERMQQTLPDYMVPSAFIVLHKLPLSVNGKIDRAALPAPQIQPLEQDKYEVPRDDLERRLAGIWAQVLKVPKVGLHDNFFVLGGHSLLATQVIARVSQAGLGQLVVRTLFDAPTVARLAAAIRSLPSGVTAKPEIPISNIPRLARVWKS